MATTPAAERSVQRAGTITVRGDYVRFADPEGIDLGRVSIPWIDSEDRHEIARRIGQLVHAPSPSGQV